MMNDVTHSTETVDVPKLIEALRTLGTSFVEGRQYRHGMHIPARPYEDGDLICGRAARELERMQAKIDALMFEYKPDEMTPEQIAEWWKHQRPGCPSVVGKVGDVVPRAPLEFVDDKE